MPLVCLAHATPKTEHAANTSRVMGNTSALEGSVLASISSRVLLFRANLTCQDVLAWLQCQ